MSADIDPATQPTPTRKQMRQLVKDIAYFEKAARDAPKKELALVAFGIAAGLKMATDAYQQTATAPK